MPENTGFMIAAYVITTLLYFGYAVFLFLRGRKLTREAEGLKS